MDCHLCRLVGKSQSCCRQCRYDWTQRQDTDGLISLTIKVTRQGKWFQISCLIREVSLRLPFLCLYTKNVMIRSFSGHGPVMLTFFPRIALVLLSITHVVTYWKCHGYEKSFPRLQRLKNGPFTVRLRFIYGPFTVHYRNITPISRLFFPKNLHMCKSLRILEFVRWYFGPPAKAGSRRIYVRVLPDIRGV